MSGNSRPFEDRIDAYLDGAMSFDGQQQFERAMVDDAQLRADTAHGKAINSSLQTLLAPPPVSLWVRKIASHDMTRNGHVNGTANGVIQETDTPKLLLTEAQPVVKNSAGRVFRLPRWLAVAAVVLLLASGALILLFAVGGGANSGYNATKFRTLAQAYADIDEPQWVCETAEEFAGTFDGRFRVPILFNSDASDVSLAGLAYCHTLTRDTVCLVGEAVGNKVLVFIDRLERDPHPQLPNDSGLNLFRREVGGLVMYEVSPNKQAMLLDWISTSGD